MTLALAGGLAMATSSDSLALPNLTAITYTPKIIKEINTMLHLT